MAHKLVERGFNVSGLARHVANRNVHLDGVSIHLGDIRNYADIRKILEKVKPDILVHLAAQTPVEYSFTHEQEIMETNFIGTCNIAGIAREVLPDLEKFIFANSVEVYGNQTRFPITEDNPINPASPYAVAKSASEIYLNYLHRGYGFPSIVLRTTNTYGRDRTNIFVIEHIIYNMLSGAKEISMGVPDSIRDYLFVEDEVDAYLKLIELHDSKVLGEIFNTGTKVGISVRDLFEMIHVKIGCDTVPIWWKNSPRPYEIKKLVIDADKINRFIGWKPKYSLSVGLDKTIEMWNNK